MKPIKHEHKKELHDRVIERSAQLKASLIQLQTDSDGAKSERAQAVEQALAALDTKMSADWNTIDEAGSAALSTWLETSKHLFDATVAAEATRKGNGTKGPGRTVKGSPRTN
jgi:hypothetical protein